MKPNFTNCLSSGLMYKIGKLYKHNSHHDVRKYNGEKRIPQQQSCTAISEQLLMLLSTCSPMFAREMHSKANLSLRFPWKQTSGNCCVPENFRTGAKSIIFTWKYFIIKGEVIFLELCPTMLERKYSLPPFYENIFLSIL